VSVGGSDAEAVVRDEARAWLAEHWKGVDDLGWRLALFASGYAVPSWPVGAGGRGRDDAAVQAIADEFDAAGAPGACREHTPFQEDPWLFMAGGPITAFGSAEQYQRLLGPVVTGELSKGCLLYSEPGAGSDLAGLQTRAELDGDEYVVNGQKVWTSGADAADFGLLIARTDWDVPKHAGLSFFFFPMRQPGVEVRPIRQITGGSRFSEVFLTDARVPAGNLIGGAGNGWKVLQVALAVERRGMSELPLDSAGDAQTADGRPPLFSRSDDLIALARDAGRLGDPVVRDEIMRIHSWRLVNDWTSARAADEMRTSGSSSLASLGKLANSRILHRAAALRFRLLGSRALEYDETDDREAYQIDYDLMMSFINSIGGGSDQIQRNIISERVLGLPRGPEPDRGVPFRDVLKADATRSLGRT
jgi:alkylation response protein AidB-like acyl-CoA dehydrogenase